MRESHFGETTSERTPRRVNISLSRIAPVTEVNDNKKRKGNRSKDGGGGGGFLRPFENLVDGPSHPGQPILRSSGFPASADPRSV